MPTDDEVLVRVYAAAVNAADWHVMRGDPYLARLVIGLGRPKAKIRGRDFAGRVEAVGRNVTRLRPGDEVYGDLGLADGAFAEYVVRPGQRRGREAGQPDVRAGSGGSAVGEHGPRRPP